MRILAGAGALAVVLALGAAALPTYLNSKPSAAGFQATAADFALAVPQGLIPTPSASPSPHPTSTPKSPSPTKSAAPVAAKPVTRTRPSVAVRSTQQSFINQDRARYHLAPLTWSSCLYNVARYEAAHLAQPGVTFKHYDGVSRDLSCHLGRQVGENIGWYSGGINDTWMNNAFMASAEHKANILGPYHYVATAWAVDATGKAFIAVEFG